MMKRLAQWVSLLALVGTILPALLFFAGRIQLDQVKFWMLAATLAWFVAAPLWMEHKVGE
jgi:hypothetical protein